MEITAQIKGIKYQPIITTTLKSVKWDEFNINNIPSSCIVTGQSKEFALSKWVSPKRTRSYPYARVYDTIARTRKVTVIPVIKDEGLDGDRDFMQWDTISLMSLLEVYIVFAYYDRADKHKKYKNKVTNQKFNNEFVKSKLIELDSYQSSALHWNIKETRESLYDVVSLQVRAYEEIGGKIGDKFKDAKNILTFQSKIKDDLEDFMQSSRLKAHQAQSREKLTKHSQEYLQRNTKASITISNYLGGKYFFTVDEVDIVEREIELIESKHTNKKLLPSLGDIKDGLIKMILYSNLTEVRDSDGKIYDFQPVLRLSSSKIIGSIDSRNSSDNEIDIFLISNRLKGKSKTIKNLFLDAKTNNYVVLILGGE